jgi:hypothetical protein
LFNGYDERHVRTNLQKPFKTTDSKHAVPTRQAVEARS